MISVIITAYNVEPYIEKCIYSVLSQTYSDIEVIVVNDGSTDKTRDICDKIAKEDERIIVIHKENGGSSSARNAGIDVAQGEFITFVDGDDYIEKNMYEEMLGEMKADNISIVNCGIIVTNIDGKESVAVSKEKKLYSKEEAMLDFYDGGANISATVCTKLYRRELFDKNIRFNNNVIHEDTEAMPRFLDASDHILVMDKAFYHYVKRVNSKTTIKKFNLKGYHFLDSLRDYEKMCKEKYAAILPYFQHYELVTTYEMLLRLRSCDDCKLYKKQEISLRSRMFFGSFKCMKWKIIREKYGNQIKEILVRSVLKV